MPIWRLRSFPAILQAVLHAAGASSLQETLLPTSCATNAAHNLGTHWEVTMKLQKTYTPKPADIEAAWFVVDATDVPLGRLASRVAQILRGKHKVTYAPHVDGGDYVVVINAEKVAVTSGKSQSKIYYRHSGYPGGLKEESFERLKERRPEAIVERAVRGMIPKNRLGRQINRKLRVYAGPDHPHGSQNPEVLEFNVRKVES